MGVVGGSRHHVGMAPPSPTSRLGPLDTLWQARTIIWIIAAGEGVALMLALAPGIEGDRWILFGLASLAIQWVLLSALGGLYLLRRPLNELSPLHTAVVALAMLLAASWLIGTLAVVLGKRLYPALELDPWGIAIRLSGLTLTLGAMGLAAFYNHWQARSAAVRTKHAELESLQARTHPHFLFNSLNTAIALVHQRPEDAERVLLDLSDLFRAALAGPRHIRLAEEIGLVRRYLEIEQLRLGDRLAVDWELPPALPEAEVPALSVQPLVENAVRHGIEHRVDGGRIGILVTADEDWIHVTVRNDLPNREHSSAPAAGHGVGLPSVASRVEAMTDGRGALSTDAVDGRYVATIRLPVASPAA